MSVTYPYVLRQGLVMTDNGEYFPGVIYRLGFPQLVILLMS